MELIRLAALGAALALALGGCGTPGDASSAPASEAPPASSGEPAPEEPREHLDRVIEKEWAPLCILEMTVEHLSGKQAIELVPKTK